MELLSPNILDWDKLTDLPIIQVFNYLSFKKSTNKE
jgi:hypothetical protein